MFGVRQFANNGPLLAHVWSCVLSFATCNFQLSGITSMASTLTRSKPNGLLYVGPHERHWCPRRLQKMVARIVVAADKLDTEKGVFDGVCHKFFRRYKLCKRFSLRILPKFSFRFELHCTNSHHISHYRNYFFSCQNIFFFCNITLDFF